MLSELGAACPNVVGKDEFKNLIQFATSFATDGTTANRGTKRRPVAVVADY